MELSISLEDPAQPEIIDLLADGERYSASLYAAESNHHLLLDALRAPHIRFWSRATAPGARSRPARSHYSALKVNLGQN